MAEDLLRITIEVGGGTAEFGVLGENQLSVAINRVLEAVDDLRWLWPYWREIFLEIEQETFANEGGASGPWAPLSDNPPGHGYESWKRAHYGELPILVLSGRLRDSLTGESSELVYEEYPQEMTIGTSVEYAGYHQTGTYKMPARPPIDIDSTQAKLFAEGLEIAARAMEYVWSGNGGLP